MSPRPIQKISGPKLAAARRKLFLSQKQLGDRAGLTESRIGQIEQAATAGVPLNRVPLLAAALEISSEEFVRRIGVDVASEPPAGRGDEAVHPKVPRHPPDLTPHEKTARQDRQVVLSLNNALAAEKLGARAAAAGRSISDYAADLVLHAVRESPGSGKSMKRAAKQMGRSRGKRR